MAQQVEKIYSLKTLGFDAIMSELDQLSKKFVEIKKAKQDAAKAAADTAKLQGVESQAYRDAAKALDEQKIKELELKTAIKEKTNEAKAAQLVRQEEVNQQKAAISGNTAELNSIAAIRKERALLNAAVISVTPGNPVQFQGNTLQYDVAIAKLKELSAVEQAFRRQFQQDGTLVGEYTSGIIQAFKKMGIDDLVKGQVSRANEQLTGLNSEFERLKQELLAIRESGQGSLSNLEKQLIDNRNAAGLLEKEVGRLQTELRGTGDIGNQITTGLANGFKNMKGQLAQFLLSYVGFQAAFNGILSGIDTAKELSDQTTALEVEFGKAAGGMDKFTTALSKLNTRTPLTELENIANIAAKAGVSEENLVGVSQAIDKIKIAFGKDFGDVESGTESLVKLVNIFEGTANVTGDNLLKTGNAVRTLANESVASVPFLTDFAKRMAGLKGISDIALPAVLGLGSGFEQFGQSAEVAGTTLTKVIPKLASDTAKYAHIAGLTQQAFADLLKNNPAEALIKVSEGLVKGKANIEEISKAFADSQLGSGRVAAILGTVGAKADDFRKAIASAGTAFNSTANIETAFTAKNENLAATLDKISKSFLDAANSTAFRVTLTAISGLITLLIGHIGVIITALGFFATTWAIANAAMIRTRIVTLATNLAFQAQYALLVIGETITKSYAVALEFLSGATGTAAVATTAFGVALRLLAGPIGIIISIVGLTVLAFKAFGEKVSGVSDSFRTLIKQHEDYRSSLTQARSDIADQIAKETTLIAILNSHSTAEQTKTQALKDLIAMNPEYLNGLTLQNATLKEGKDILDAYNNALLLKAQRQAADAIKSKSFNDLITAQRIKYELEQKKAALDSGQKVGFAELTDEQKALFPNGLLTQRGFNLTATFFNSKLIESELTTAIQNANAVIRKKEVDVNAAEKNAVDVADKARLADKAILVVQETQINDRITIMRQNLQKMRDASQQDTEGYKQLNAELNVSLAQRDKIRDKILGTTKPDAAPATTSADVDLEELKNQLAGINKQIAAIDSIKNKSAEQLSQLKLLRAQRTEIRKEIVEKGGSLKTANPDKAVTDQLSIIDSDLKTELAKQETKIINLQKIDSLIVGEASKTRKLTAQEETQNVIDTAVINTKYLDQKIAYLNSRKSLDAKEKEQLAGFIKEKADIQLKGITAIQEINNREFTERQTGLRNQLDQEIAAIKEADAIVQNDPNKSFADKAQSKLDSDNKVLKLYREYNVNVDILEKQLLQQTTKNSREIVKAQQQTTVEIIKDRTEIELARIKDIQREGDAEIVQENIKYENIRKSILDNEKLTDTEKNRLLNQLSSANNITLLTKELETLDQQLIHKTLMYAQDNLTDEEYQKAKDERLKKAGDLEAAIIAANNKKRDDAFKAKPHNVQEAASQGVDSLLGVDPNSPEGQAVAEATTQAFALATDAMHGYYDAERARIQQSLDLNLKRLDLEEEQVKSRAKSQAELDSIDKQYAAKKAAAQKAAGEETKKSKRAELKIALVTEIANDAVAAAAYPFPFNLGIFAVMAALAYGRYAVGLSAINSAQFAQGGEVPKRGGKFGGKQHSQGGTKFNYQNEQYEAEVDELAIIRTRNAPARNKVFQIMGTHQQIASQLNVLGGGIEFAPGAKLKRFAEGGFLGSSLQAPVFVASSNSSTGNSANGISKDQFDTLISRIDTMNAETSKRIDRMQVVQVTSSVTKAQAKQVQQRAIGTIG